MRQYPITPVARLLRPGFSRRDDPTLSGSCRLDHAIASPSVLPDADSSRIDSARHVRKSDVPDHYNGVQVRVRDDPEGRRSVPRYVRPEHHHE